MTNSNITEDLTNSDVSQNFSLNLSKLTVTVKDSSGNPESGAFVRETNGSGTTTISSNGNNYSFTVNNVNSSGNTGSNGTYTLTVPQGTSFTANSGINVKFTDGTSTYYTSALTVSNDMNIVVQEASTHTFSGYLTDQNGNPVSGTTVTIGNSSAHDGSASTNSAGYFSITVPAGSYSSLTFNNSSGIMTNSNITEDLTNSDVSQNFSLNLSKLTVTVKDSSGNPESGAFVRETNGSGTTTISSNGNNYSFTVNNVNSSGNTGSNGTYTLTVPQGTSFTANSGINVKFTDGTSTYYTSALTVLSNVNLIFQQGEPTIIYTGPTTTAILSPKPFSDGLYADPTTVTLSATVASGYTVANTYYTIDGGSQQTYTAPFTVTGAGSHTITYWSVDNSGVTEATDTKTFTITESYSLTGIVYNDANQNGVQVSGEQGYAGATITLNTGQSTTTDNNGNYTFSNLEAGTYTETLTVPDGYTATTTNPATVALAADTTENFGIAQQQATPIVAINAGGDTQGSYVADTDYSGGTAYSTTDSVDTSNVTNPAPQAVYQTVRYGNFTYTIPNLTANGTYTVRLHFNELYWNAAGQRTFNTSINGTQVLSNFDIYQTAGGKDKAIVEQFPATADANGNITIQFTSVIDNAMVNGIEIYNGTLPSPTSTPSPTPVQSASINAGGDTVGDYLADNGYTGGTTYSTTASIDTSGVTSPATEAVYQTVRYGNFSYTIPTNSPDTNYTVRLDFAEPYWDAAGQRLFNVTINGIQDLSDFDVYQAAGGENKAVSETFNTTTDSNGLIKIQFDSVVDNAMVSGIQVSQ